MQCLTYHRVTRGMRGRPPPCTCWTAGEESRGALCDVSLSFTLVDWSLWSTQALVVEQRWRGGRRVGAGGEGHAKRGDSERLPQRRDRGGGGGGTTSYTTLCVKVPSDFQLDYSDSEAFFFFYYCTNSPVPHRGPPCGYSGAPAGPHFPPAGEWAAPVASLL